MKIKVVVLSLIMLLFTGCAQEKINKVYLDDNFYDGGTYIEISSEELNALDDSTYVIFTYNNFCNMKIPCDEVFENVMKENNVSFYSIPFTGLKDTYLYETVSYGPSVIIVSNKEVIAYLDAESDDDLPLYQSEKKFTKWLSKYIYLEK